MGLVLCLGEGAVKEEIFHTLRNSLIGQDRWKRWDLRGSVTEGTQKAKQNSPQRLLLNISSYLKSDSHALTRGRE